MNQPPQSDPLPLNKQRYATLPVSSFLSEREKGMVVVVVL